MALPNKVGWIVEAAALLAIGAGNPSPADHGHDRIAQGQTPIQNHDEVFAQADAVDIPKQILPADRAFQPVVDEPCETGGILPPIADEDAACHLDALASFAELSRKAPSFN